MLTPRSHCFLEDNKKKTRFELLMYKVPMIDSAEYIGTNRIPFTLGLEYQSPSMFDKEKILGLELLY